MKQIASMAVALLFMLACTRKPQNHYNYADPSIDAFIIFDTGSYWVYVDSVSEKTDSFSVTRFSDHFSVHDYYDYYQERSVSVKQYQTDPVGDSFLWAYGAEWVSDYYIWSLRVDSIGNGSISDHDKYYQLFRVGILLENDNINNPMNYEGSYSNGTLSFDSIYRFTLENSVGDSIRFYFRRNIGPIRIEYISDGKYIYINNLINYNVKPKI